MVELARESWWRDGNKAHNPFAPGGGVTFTAKAVTDAQVLILVTGQRAFPVHMLRHDNVFCASPISHPEHPWTHRPHHVLVRGYSSRISMEQWKNCGWDVDNWGQRAETCATLNVRTLLWRGFCHRCFAETGGYAMSLFNGALICSVCESEEREHPDFDLARNSWRYALIMGNYTYQGIGWLGAFERHV